MRVLLASLLLFVSSLGQAQFGATNQDADPWGATTGPSFLPVEAAYQLEIETIDAQHLRLYWQIADSYYLYQHRFKFALEDARGPIAVTPELPPALARSDEYFGDVQVYYNSADISLQLARPTTTARLTVTSQGCADAGLCYPPHQQLFEVNFETGAITPLAPPRRASDTTANYPADSAGGSLPYMLLLAFLGGAILNLMPCVFPILSLKVLSFAGSSDDYRHHQGWIYAAGVVSSFVLVAALLISLQQAGRAIGWGFQLQSPGFVIALAYLFLVMGLSLSGLVQLGGGIMNMGSGLAGREGSLGSFFTGVLAVVVASPCTAPLMGTALGFAVTQPAPVALAIFAALGAGMAAPLVLLSYSRWARSLLPKPGVWMEHLKQFLAFPLYASAIWLLWVAGRQTGVNTMAAALTGGLLLALGLWLWGARWWRRALAFACVALAVSLASWRETGTGHSNQLAAGTEPWSAQRLQELRSAGQAVFVDVTADWCITCIANERAVLHTAEMAAAFNRHGVTYLVADWTNHNAEIAGFLRQHGRNGIPLYLLYPADANSAPVILPQLLTKSTVLDALRNASPGKKDVARTL